MRLVVDEEMSVVDDFLELFGLKLHRRAVGLLFDLFQHRLVLRAL